MSLLSRFFSLSMAMCGLVSALPSPLPAGESNVRGAGATGIIPPVIIAPVIDGADDDSAWRSPESKIIRAEENGFSVSLACDSQQVYFLMRCPKPAKDGAYFDIRMGRAPWLEKRILIKRGDSPEACRWDIWGWQEQDEYALLKSVDTDREWVVEFAFSRTVLGCVAADGIMPLALEVTHWRPGDGKRKVEFVDGDGILIGADVGLKGVSCHERTDGKTDVTVTVINALPEVRNAKLIFEFLDDAGAPAIQEMPVLLNRTGVSDLSFDLGREPSKVILRVEGLPDQTVYPHEILPVSDSALILKALRDSIGEVENRNIFSAIHHLEVGDSEAAAESLAALLDDLAADGKFPLSENAKFYDAPPPPGVSLENGFSEDGLPRWDDLSELAGRFAYWRPLYVNSLACAGLGFPGSADDPRVDIRFRLTLAAYDNWAKFRQERGELFTDNLLRPESRPDVTAYRAQALGLAAATVFGSGIGKKKLIRVLAECYRTQSKTLQTILQEKGRFPRRFDTALRLADNARRLPFLFGARKWKGLLCAAADSVLAANITPDGSGVFFPGSEMIALANWMKLYERLEVKPREGAGLSAAKRVFSSIANRSMASGRIAFASCDNDGMPDSETLSDWAHKLFPDSPEFSRFLPEEQAAFLLVRSTPEGGGDTYGGVYVCRGDGVSLAVAAPAASPDSDCGSAGYFGSILLSTRDSDLLIEPHAKNVLWPGAILVNGNGPVRQRLPESGFPLPHRWITGSAFDSLVLEWGAPGEELCTRRIVFCKLGYPYAYICDKVSGNAGEVRLEQNFLVDENSKKQMGVYGFSRSAVSPEVKWPPVAEYSGEKNSANILTVSSTLSRGASLETIIVPLAEETGERTKVHAARRLGNPSSKSVGVLEVSRGDGSRELYFHNDNNSQAAADFPGGSVQLEGEMAVVGFSSQGINHILCLDVSSFALNMGASFEFVFSEKASVALERRAGGSWSARLESRSDMPVKMEMARSAADGKREQAEINLISGKTVVFRPF